MPATATTTGAVNVVGNTAFYSGQTNYMGGGISNWNCTRMLEVDGSNRVVSWQYEGNNCPFMELGPYSTWRRK